MKTYAVPYCYYIAYDDSTTPYVEIVQAENPTKAQEQTHKAIEDHEKEQDQQYIPEIWLAGQRGTDEGYIIGEPIEIEQL